MVDKIVAAAVQAELTRRLRIFYLVSTEVMQLYWNVEDAEKTGDQELINAEKARVVERLAQIMHWK